VSKTEKLIPVFTSAGDIGAIFMAPHLFNLNGEWIGWVDEQRTVYSVHGHYVGMLTKDPRIIQKREWSYDVQRRTPPTPPGKIRPPDHFPLPPLMPELPSTMIDVLSDHPELLPGLDFGDLRDDMD